MNRILITGIAGFIGSNLSRALLDKGYVVYGVDNLEVGKEQYLDTRVKDFWKIDLGREQPGSHYPIVDRIVHLASKKIPRDGSASAVLISAVESIRAVVQLALKRNASIIYASTSDVYGKQSKFFEDSDSIIGPPWVSRWSYAVSKMWCEQLLYSLSRYLKFNIVRYFGSYGPYMSLTWRAGPPSVFVQQALNGEPLTVHGTGEQTRCFSYVDDVVDGTISLMESDENHQIFNLGNPDHEISMNDFAAKVIRLTGSTSAIKHVPYMKDNASYEDVLARRPDISRAFERLGYKPKIGLNVGMVRTIDLIKGELKIA